MYGQQSPPGDGRSVAQHQYQADAAVVCAASLASGDGVERDDFKWREVDGKEFACVDLLHAVAAPAVNQCWYLLFGENA